MAVLYFMLINNAIGDFEKVTVSKYEVFIKVAEFGGLTRAAEYFGCTQSNVSHIINSLESEFGFRLMYRGRGGAKLTPEGQKILPAVRAVVTALEDLARAAQDVRGPDSGTIRVGAFSSVAVHWLPGIIKSFQAEYPNISLKLLNGDYHDVDTWLIDGEVDVAFITLPTELDCEVIPLCEDRLMAVLPPDHPKAGPGRLPVSEIEGEPFITLLETSDQDSRRAVEAAGVKPDIRFTTKDDYAIIAMVENGLGMSIMPELLLEGHAGKVCMMELEPPSVRTIALAIPGKSSGFTAAARFAEYVRRWVAQRGAR